MSHLPERTALGDEGLNDDRHQVRLMGRHQRAVSVFRGQRAVEMDHEGPCQFSIERDNGGVGFFDRKTHRLQERNGLLAVSCSRQQVCERRSRPRDTLEVADFLVTSHCAPEVVFGN